MINSYKNNKMIDAMVLTHLVILVNRSYYGAQESLVVYFPITITWHKLQFSSLLQYKAFKDLQNNERFFLDCLFGSCSVKWSFTELSEYSSSIKLLNIQNNKGSIWNKNQSRNMSIYVTAAFISVFRSQWIWCCAYS